MHIYLGHKYKYGIRDKMDPDNITHEYFFGSASAGRSDARVNTSFRAPRGARATRATRGEGRAAPPIRKNPAAALYGCPASPRRRNATPDLVFKHPNTTVATYI
jgi:hypothetical protein